MEILGPNVNSQTRPEEVECFEGFEGIPVFKRSRNSAKQFVKFLVILLVDPQCFPTSSPRLKSADLN